jgi:N-acetylglucosamine-6-phosphate deacetylase
LGENVKQSNWGDDNTTRYPQTRMGVEQILRDAFSSAVEYKNEWHDYNNNPKQWKKKVPPRRDLELEALVEILDGKRQIHCHSYRQDEILMLTRVAEDFGFTVGTFQHVLEGYKVADRIKQHGANASTFTDWWAYKYEVIDAIPYNGALMTDVGVNVSFNSDSGELARRMNTEAAKGVKYGGLSEEDALKMITLNPATQLGIDQWVGSLEIGKDADFVIWSDHPLSSTAICEQTWIDGIQYFSLEQDKQFQKRDRVFRKKLINKILSVGDEQNKKEWKHHEEKSLKHFHCQEEF